MPFVFCVLVALPHGIMGWSMIVAFSGRSHMSFMCMCLCFIVSLPYNAMGCDLTITHHSDVIDDAKDPHTQSFT